MTTIDTFPFIHPVDDTQNTFHTMFPTHDMGSIDTGDDALYLSEDDMEDFEVEDANKSSFQDKETPSTPLKKTIDSYREESIQSTLSITPILDESIATSEDNENNEQIPQAEIESSSDQVDDESALENTDQINNDDDDHEEHLATGDCEYEETAEDEDHEEADMKDFEPVPVPVILTYNLKSYKAFTDTSKDSSPILFPQRSSLFKLPLESFIESLQEHFHITNDISLFFPQLKLKFFPHMVFIEKLSLMELSFLASKAVKTDNFVLQVELLEEEISFADQYNRLLNFTKEDENTTQHNSKAEDTLENIVNNNNNNESACYNNDDDIEDDHFSESLLTKRPRNVEDTTANKRQKL